MHNQHAGPLAFDRGVISQKTLQHRVALSVFDRLGMNLRLDRQHGTQAQQYWNQ